ncbi:MAG: Asp-tRNA(Asn)/Glu-tRNA(Gln) amidotransferase GatCAB subunit B, partial [Gammaproteobacteria bacterium]|nr:Asp-tRNA(Asn)/Glu-tRNA(Gln) amidotransferase GatCAB subunit B [Gammaproteobacteria bacterium]
IIEARGLKQISDSAELEQIVEKILSKFSEQADQVRQGQGKVLGFLVGQVMKETGGKANPKAVNEILSRKLSP